jgi:hypothetical protein
MSKTTNQEPLVRLAAATRAWAEHQRGRAEDERGEGVISMAIAILIVSFLGVAAWLAFKGILDGTEDKVQSGVEQVGR